MTPLPVAQPRDDWRTIAGAGGGAVGLLSGGLDSGVAHALWRQAGGRLVLTLTADYGQRGAGREESAARAWADRWAVPWRRIDLRWLGEPARHAGCTLLPGNAAPPTTSTAAPGDASTAAAVWVPARNVVLCAAAAAFAEALGAECVLTGFNAEEAQTFADNSRAFTDAFDAVLALGCRRTVRVVSPTLDLDKVEIVEAARRLGLRQEMFWSCYGGGDTPCGRCESCCRSARAWGMPATEPS